MTGTGQGGAALAEAPGRPPAPGTQPPAEPTLTLPVAVLAVLATVVVALLAVALVVRVDVDHLPSGPPRDPPPPPPPVSRFTEDGTSLSFQELKIRLPGPPYVCGGDVVGPPDGFTQLSLCQTTVHKDYDGRGHDWVAVTGLGLVQEPVVDPGDLEQTTKAAFDALYDLSFQPSDHPRLSRVSEGTADVAAPAGSARTRQADVNVRVPRLPTTYDRLVVIVVRLESGRHVVFFSDFPHDGSKEALAAVVASASSLTAQR